MPTVQSTVTDAAGDPVEGAQVVIRLIATLPETTPAAGFVGADDETIVSQITLATDTDGEWSTNLVANDLITPEGTYYVVTERADVTPRRPAVKYRIAVPDGAGPYWAGDLLVNAPDDLPSVASVASAVGSNPTGAVTATNVQAAIAELEALAAANLHVSNVLEFGALGDGATDDIDAINDATLDGAGGIVYFPWGASGVYLISEPILYHSNQRWILAPGVKIKLKAATVANLVTAGVNGSVGMVVPAGPTITNVTIDDLYLDGNKANNPTANSGDGICIQGPAISDITLNRPRFVDIPRDCIAIGSGSANVGERPERIRIKGVRADDTGLLGVNGSNVIALIAGYDIEIDGIVGHNVAYDGTASGVVVDFEPNLAFAKCIERVKLKNVRAYGTIRGGIILAAAAITDSIVDVEIEDATVTGADGGAFRFDGNDPAIATLGGVRDLRVAGLHAVGNSSKGFEWSNVRDFSTRDCLAQSNTLAPNDGYEFNDSFFGVVERCRSEGAFRYGFSEDGSDGIAYVACRSQSHTTGAYLLDGASSSVVGDAVRGFTRLPRYPTAALTNALAAAAGDGALMYDKDLDVLKVSDGTTWLTVGP